jgi:hypothetical protein
MSKGLVGDTRPRAYFDIRIYFSLEKKVKNCYKESHYLNIPVAEQDS